MYDKGGLLRDLDNYTLKKIISESCEITVNQKIKDTGGTHLLRLKNQFIASNFKPGQFVMLKANAGGFDPLLSRPFSIFNKFNENEFEVLYRVYGKGTDILSNISKGNSVNIVGPLGNGFNFNAGLKEYCNDNKCGKSGKRRIIVLVAGGIGIAPLYSIPDFINGNSNNAVNNDESNDINNIGDIVKDKIILYYGARKAEELYFRYSIHSRFDEVYFATDDGSFGFKGSIIQLLAKNISEYLSEGEDASFYACGPKPMLKALISMFNKEAGLSSRLQVSLEENFGCGVGVCLGCVVKCTISRVSGIEPAEGDFVYKRVCKDGPVFFANHLYDYNNIDVSLSASPKNCLSLNTVIKTEAESGSVDNLYDKYGKKNDSQNKDSQNKDVNLSVRLGKLLIDYPVMPASGTFGYGEEFIEILDYTYFGALVSKGISLNPSKGNEMQRISETYCGLINSIGLQNVGFERFKEEKLPFLKSFHKPVIVNFFGKSVEEYVKLAEMLSRLDGISALEANISCPNIKEGGRSFGSDPEVVYELISSVKEIIGDNLPLIAKLAPMVTDISLIAEVCEKAGADIISLINTIPSASIDIKTKSFKLNRGFGGLSGPAVKPIALKLVNDVYNSVRIPVIGMGGISSCEDAVEFFLAGATAVAVGTYSFINPKIIPQIVEGVKKYLTDNGFNDIYDIIGLANKNKQG